MDSVDQQGTSRAAAAGGFVVIRARKLSMTVSAPFRFKYLEVLRGETNSGEALPDGGPMRVGKTQPNAIRRIATAERSH
jgi:hypothetical protein